jgi:8-hydroxy-5-deazaflavin:NADPH oxidoreductase
VRGRSREHEAGDDAHPSGPAIVGIVGAGRMAAGIARRLAGAGRCVRVYDHDSARARDLAGAAAALGRSRVEAAPLEAVLDAPVVILAVRFPGTLAFAREHRGLLAGRVVVDVSTPLDDSYEHLLLEPTTSGAEELARVAPQSRIVKAFNTNLAVTLPDAQIEGVALDTFVASDDADAKATVIDALQGSGLRPLDAGALCNSRVLEAIAALGIELGDRYGLGQSFGFKYLPSRPLTTPPT